MCDKSERDLRGIKVDEIPIAILIQLIAAARYFAMLNSPKFEKFHKQFKLRNFLPT